MRTGICAELAAAQPSYRAGNCCSASRRNGHCLDSFEHFFAPKTGLAKISYVRATPIAVRGSYARLHQVGEPYEAIRSIVFTSRSMCGGAWWRELAYIVRRQP